MRGPIEIGGDPVDLSRCPYATIYFQGTGVVSSGSLVIEESQTPDWPGAWVAIGSPFAASGVNGGAQAAVHLTPGAYAYVRVRAATAVGGGGSVAAFIEAIPH